jgi:hypothetical protein
MLLGREATLFQARIPRDQRVNIECSQKVSMHREETPELLFRVTQHAESSHRTLGMY